MKTVPVPGSDEYAPPLDKGIERPVHILREAEIETYESCEGGDGHSFPEPTVRFDGNYTDGFKAFAVAMQHGLPVDTLRRVWIVIDGELTGPTWEMTFDHPGERPFPWWTKKHPSENDSAEED